MARSDKSVLGLWWRNTDRWTFAAFMALIAAGVFLVSAASPSVAERIGLAPFHFVKRHIVFLFPALGALLAMSLASRQTLWRVSTLVFSGSLFLCILAIFMGPEIKGATRWVHMFGVSLQPSEFLKPSLAIVSAWLMARHHDRENFPGYQLSITAFLIAAGVLLVQPDFGMTFVLACIWGAQLFMAGLPLLLVFVLGGLVVAGIIGAYIMLPHVASRIDRFLDPAAGDNYQVQKSLDAFGNGGLFGTGPAHGQVKLKLPDAHADFIFAVIGEELGLIATLLLVSVFCFIIVRSFMRIRHSDDLFVVLATGGLLTQLALQSLIHMGSSLQLLPAKGMTLPFISYGGSSLIATGFSAGLLLALTRRRAGTAPDPSWSPVFRGKKAHA
ncbi:MAG: putative peptidoglycan glycosyltransferase FtsW [Alphaproteobacteria bacterium]|nr:putative peptidoglycan glycosyltransferase FtsW [Alphaproteobacteria bacterium]